MKQETPANLGRSRSPPISGSGDQEVQGLRNGSVNISNSHAFMEGPDNFFIRYVYDFCCLLTKMQYEGDRPSVSLQSNYAWNLLFQLCSINVSSFNGHGNLVSRIFITVSFQGN